VAASRRITDALSARQSRTAFSAIVPSTFRRSKPEALIASSTSRVATCCSRALASAAAVSVSFAPRALAAFKPSSPRARSC